jgi:excisionase family DNA binding protein
MSPLAVRKSLIGSADNHRPLHHSARYNERRVKASSAGERIPAQPTAQYNGPAAGDLLEAVPALNAVSKTVSVKEAAYRLRKSPDTIYLWLRHGRLKGWQPGGAGCQIQVLESSVEHAQRNILGIAIATTA